ncbi:MAG: HPr family phosphocarrier protein [Thermodesulfobacteriota bacterium]
MPKESPYNCEVVLANSHGLHARPATLLVEKAQEFKSEIFIMANGRKADCKSILDILSCGCPSGTKIFLSATGPDRKEAVIALRNLIGEL